MVSFSRPLSCLYEAHASDLERRVSVHRILFFLHIVSSFYLTLDCSIIITRVFLDVLYSAYIVS